MVRISFAAYNTTEDIDACAAMIERITRADYRGRYYQTPDNGDYRAVGNENARLSGFSLTGAMHHRDPVEVTL